jgi:NaMN:DMB phosphoribosyltransferase
MTKEFEALRAQLQDDPPEGLRRLGGAELADLAGAVDGARRRQAKALAAAGDRALRHIPRVLRGPVRRVVG